MCAKTTPLVPNVVNAIPSSTVPVPTAAAALSPAPPTTGVPAGTPQSSAALALTFPVISGDSYTFARSEGSMPSLESTSSDHLRFGTSKSCIPEASLTSVANSPVSM